MVHHKRYNVSQKLEPYMWEYVRKYNGHVRFVQLQPKGLKEYDIEFETSADYDSFRKEFEPIELKDYWGTLWEKMSGRNTAYFFMYISVPKCRNKYDSKNVASNETLLSHTKTERIVV